MQGGNPGEVLLRVADRLLDELSDPVSVDSTGAHSTLGAKPATAGDLGAEEEWLVRRVREAFARIAATLGAEHDDAPVSGVKAALDSTEMVMRGALVSGTAERLPRLMPSFVFLVALPIIEQDRALALSRRTVELVAEEMAAEGE